MSIDDLTTTLEQERAERERLAAAAGISPKTALLLDTERLGKIAVAVDLFRQASEARRTAVLLAEIGCTGSAADCRVLGHDLDKRAGEVLGVKP